MIVLGADTVQKNRTIARYCADKDIQRVFVLSPEKFRFPCNTPAEWIEWAEIIKYRFYYRLLREIDGHTLVVVNECLRSQNRHDLTYNCIRLFLNQTEHQLIFQYLPMIDTVDDFMILFDFDTRSRWKREKFRPELLKETTIQMQATPPNLQAIPVATDAKTKAVYARTKRNLIGNIGLKDPHTIPRNLYLLSGKSKLPHVESGRCYVGRNNRFKIERFQTYREPAYPEPCTVFEFCHNFIDFADYLSLSRQVVVPVLVADLKVEQWYFERYTQWTQRLRDACAILR